MALQPTAFLHFASTYLNLLRSLYWHPEDLMEAEVFDYIYTHKRTLGNDSTPSAKRIFHQLKALKFIRTIPGASAYYEITNITKYLLGFFEQEHKFTSAAQIHANLDELETFHNLLQTSFRSGQKGVILSQLRDLEDLIDRLRTSSHGNRRATIQAVKEARINHNNESTAYRYEKLFDINQRYIAPLKDSIQVGQAMDTKLQMCEALLNHAKNEYFTHKDVELKIERILFLLPQLRREMLLAFEESIDEITPLLDRLRDNLFARGASAILDKVAKNGDRALQSIADRLALANPRKRTALFDDDKVADFINDVQGYQPTPPPKVNIADREIEPIYQFDFEGALQKAQNSVPIPDLFSWIGQHYGAESIQTVLVLYNRIYLSSTISTYAKVPREYTFTTNIITTYPLTIESYE